MGILKSPVIKVTIETLGSRDSVFIYYSANTCDCCYLYATMFYHSVVLNIHDHSLFTIYIHCSERIVIQVYL